MTPNIGDIRLFNQNISTRYGKEIYSGEIQIYLGDGHSPANWSKICKTDSFDFQETAILCSQLQLTYEGVYSVTSGQVVGISSRQLLMLLFLPHLGRATLPSFPISNVMTPTLCTSCNATMT